MANKVVHILPAENAGEGLTVSGRCVAAAPGCCKSPIHHTVLPPLLLMLLLLLAVAVVAFAESVGLRAAPADAATDR